MKALVALSAISMGLLSACTSYPIREPLTIKPTVCHLSHPKFAEPNDREACKKDSYYTVGWNTRESIDPHKPSKIESKAHIYILEINDQGVITNRETANAALKHVASQMADISNEENHQKKPFVNLFVHGWNNNADPNNHDLKKFERATLGFRDSQPNNQADVIGIFVSWRGKTLPAGLSHALTFWSRKAVSEEVGRGELTNFIFDLEATLKPSKQPDKNGTFILAGHSFGGSALYNAVGPTLTARFYDSIAEQQTNPDYAIRGVGDTVILLNPAIQAMRFRGLREAVYKKASEQENGDQIFKNNSSPILVVLATESDFPVKTAFPIGRTLGQLFDLESDQQMPVYQGIEGKPVLASVKDSEKKSIGFYEPYYTHFVLDTTPFKPVQQTASEILLETPKALLDIPLDVLNNPEKILTQPIKIVSSAPKALFATPKAFLGNMAHKDKDIPLNMATCLSSDLQEKLKLKQEDKIDWLTQIYTEEKFKNTQNFYTEVKTPNTKVETDLFSFKIFNTPELLDAELRQKWPLVQEYNEEVISKIKAPTWQRNPYWFVKANENFMKGHNGIWNNNVTCLLIALMTKQPVSHEMLDDGKISYLGDKLALVEKEKSSKNTELEDSSASTTH